MVIWVVLFPTGVVTRVVPNTRHYVANTALPHARVIIVLIVTGLRRPRSRHITDVGHPAGMVMIIASGIKDRAHDEEKTRDTGSRFPRYLQPASFTIGIMTSGSRQFVGEETSVVNGIVATSGLDRSGEIMISIVVMDRKAPRQLSHPSS